MKKLLALVLCILLILSLAACASETPSGGDTGGGSETGGGDTGGGDTGGGDNGGDAGGGDTEFAPVAADTSGTLKVWFDNEDIFAALQTAFNAIYPNITLEFELIGNVDARAKLELDGPSGLGADVFCMPHDHIGTAVQDGLVEPLDAALQAKLKSTLVQSACDTLTFDNEMYAVPITLENIALFYNKDLWGDTPPETFEEIFAFAESYNNAAENKWTMAWQADDAYHNYHWLSAFGMNIMGSDHRDYTKPGFDTAEALKGVEFFQTLRSKLFDVPVADAQWGGTVARFQNGEIPLTITGPWAIADAKNNGVNFGVAKIPTIEGKQPVCFSGVIIAAMSSYCPVEKQDMALTFLDFLAGPEGAKVLYEVGGKLPALLDQSQIPGLSDDAYLQGIMQQTPFTVPMPAIPEMQQGGWDGLKELFTHPWEGTLSPEEAQAKAMETYKLKLQAAGINTDF